MSASQEPRLLGKPVVSPGPARRLGITGGNEAALRADAEVDHQLGFDQGYADGMRQAAADCENRLVELQAKWQEDADARLRDAVAELDTAQHALVESAMRLDAAVNADRIWAEGAAAEIAMHALSTVLAQLPTADLVEQMVRRALVAHDTPPLQIRLSQAQVPVLTSTLTAIRTVADPDLMPGDCIIEFATGELDAGLPTRLREIAERLILALGDRDHVEPR